MSPSQAAKLIGCDASHVRRLIRNGKLQARYEISKEEVERYKSLEQSVGYPRGRKRKQND